MMGHYARSEALFYYFRLEDQVPENHLLRLNDKHVSFAFVRERLRNSYSEGGKVLSRVPDATACGCAAVDAWSTSVSMISIPVNVVPVRPPRPYSPTCQN
jgi:transposase